MFIKKSTVLEYSVHYNLLHYINLDMIIISNKSVIHEALQKTNLNGFSVLQPVTDSVRLAEELKEGRSQSAVVITSYSAQTFKPLSYCFVALKKTVHVMKVSEV